MSNTKTDVEKFKELLEFWKRYSIGSKSKFKRGSFNHKHGFKTGEIAVIQAGRQCGKSTYFNKINCKIETQKRRPKKFQI
jgi:hypothetical protein